MQAYATAFITLDGGQLTNELLAHPLVLAAHQAIGQADLIVNIGAPTDSDLARFFTAELRTIPGVRDVSVAHVGEVLLHRTHLVRF